MLWVARPPSDHDLKSYDVPPRVCGVGAVIELADPWITVRLNGVVLARLFTVSDRPDGTEARLSVVVRGSRRTLAVLVRPPASVAVSGSSREDGYSWSGALNEPLATPAKLCTVCV